MNQKINLQDFLKIKYFAKGDMEWALEFDRNRESSDLFDYAKKEREKNKSKKKIIGINAPTEELLNKARVIYEYLERECLRIGSDRNGVYSIYSISKTKFVCIPRTFEDRYYLGYEMEIIGKKIKDLEILAEFIRLPFERNKITKYVTRESECN